mmetsp:Transcript_37127/g.90252  ORF Transcript_37127/g.90252 Transcript_37127/m.90252 type:complete len:863 (-) Transcript_37127:347-2935(-)
MIEKPQIARRCRTQVEENEKSKNDGCFVYKACTEKKDIPSDVKHVKIDPFVQEIDDESFKNCTSLKTIDFSDATSLVMIGDQAFAGCKSLEEADMTGMPELKYICHQAFQGCDLLQIIGKLPSKLERIGAHAFGPAEQDDDGRTTKGSVTFKEIDFSSAESLQYIYGSAFAKCKFENVKIPPKLEAIVDKAFEGSSMQLLDFSSAESLRYIGRDAFLSSQIESEVKFPPKLETIEDAAFSFSSVPGVDFSSAASLHKIGTSAFADCKFENEIKFPPKLEQLDDEAFAASSMPRLDFSSAKSLKKIGSWAFVRCKITNDVKFSSTLEGISPRAFASSSIQRLDFSQAASLRVIGQAAFSNSKIQEEVKFPESLEEILPFAFSKARMFSVDLSMCKKLKKIKQNAFDMCVCDHMIVIPDSVEELGQDALRGATSFNLRKDVINIQSSLKTIMKYQEATNSVLADMVTAGIAPRYYVILPPSVPSQEKSAFGSLFRKYSNPQNWVMEKARVCFICPLSHQPARNSDGSVASYQVDLPQDWVAKYGPSIQFGLKFVLFGLQIGRCFGLPTLENTSTEDRIAASSEILGGMQQLLAEKLGDEDLTSLIMANNAEQIDDSKSKFEAAARTKPELKAQILQSYKGLQEWLGVKDNFRASGLVKATCTKDNSAEWVCPDMVAIYEKHGKDCFTMSTEKMAEEKAILDAKARDGGVDHQPKKPERKSSLFEILDSYKTMHETLAKDGDLRDSGLVKATCRRDGTSEWVHPGMVEVYERFGKECFKMSVETIAEKQAMLRQARNSSMELEAMKPPQLERGISSDMRSASVKTKGWLDKKVRSKAFFVQTNVGKAIRCSARRCFDLQSTQVHG